MDEIVVDNISINPYFILDVVHSDSESFITKAFRKKAKFWHPDKMSLQDSKDSSKVKKVNHHFKIIVESYEYIINKKQSFLGKTDKINIIKSNVIPTKSIDNSDELVNFNTEFDKIHITTPNDFGYTNTRMEDTKEYDNNYTPYKVFNSKNFNNSDFNKTFEYQQQSHSSTNEVSLYNTTNDGFNAYNGSDSNGSANVSSYNGVMIVGDTYGQSGLGYYDASFSDYKQSFNTAKNPIGNINIPTDFQSKIQTQKKLSTKESQEQMNLQLKHRNIPINSKENFKLQEKILLEQQDIEIKKKIENDKKILLEFQNMYSDKNMINDALNGKLIN